MTASAVHMSRFSERFDTLSYRDFFALWLGNISIFALLFVLCADIPGNGIVSAVSGAPATGLLDAFYFSIITVTTIGYGDIVPIGFSRVFAALESVTGLILFAVFVSKLLSRRQDIALSEVHRLAFRTAFHNVREELYVVRKDFDVGIRAVHDREAVSASEWKFLTLATFQVTHVLQELPDLYDKRNRLFAVDERQEQLLLDSVERSLNRVVEFCSALRDADIPCNPATRRALEQVVSHGNVAIPLWDERSVAVNVSHISGIIETLGKLVAGYAR